VKATRSWPCIVFPISWHARLRQAEAGSSTARRKGSPEVEHATHNYTWVEPEDTRREVKYESPCGAGLHIYAPRLSAPVFRDRTQMLFIVEGEKEGWPALSGREGPLSVFQA